MRADPATSNMTATQSDFVWNRCRRTSWFLELKRLDIIPGRLGNLLNPLAQVFQDAGALRNAPGTGHGSVDCENAQRPRGQRDAVVEVVHPVARRERLADDRSDALRLREVRDAGEQLTAISRVAVGARPLDGGVGVALRERDERLERTRHATRRC
jgi:hypothetical protein